MSPNTDVFRISGPVHLRYVDWNCGDHQRVVVASLVKATKTLEDDRNKQRAGREALAPAWWKHFHFELKRPLIDKNDSSIFGGIYEFKPPFPPHPSAPQFIVTFRGTMLDWEHGLQDVSLDFGVIFGGINMRSRVETATDAINHIINIYKTQKIWLGGHSLGASMATVIGKNMVMKDFFPEVFLFNPPFPSLSLDWFPNIDSNIKDHLRICKAILKAGVSIVSQNHNNISHEEFFKLSSWTPNLFINPDDPISSSYIRHFYERQKMKGTIMEHILGISTCVSLRQIIGNALVPGLEMGHLLPTARLAVKEKKLSNGQNAEVFRRWQPEIWNEAHSLHQWWEPDIYLKVSHHQYQQ